MSVRRHLAYFLSQNSWQNQLCFYITEVSLACCQDRIIPFHTLKWEFQDGAAESRKLTNARIFANNQDTDMYDMWFCMFSFSRNPIDCLHEFAREQFV